MSRKLFADATPDGRAGCDLLSTISRAVMIACANFIGAAIGIE
jgi:hypothetical protein